MTHRPHTRREFPAEVKRAAYARAAGRCETCTAPLRPGKYTYDHTIPDWMGGEPVLDNCQVLCSSCDHRKTYRRDIPEIAKGKRIHDRHIGIKRQSSRPIPGSRNSPWRKRINGRAERRI
jgi:5-methylcytosine-specific restriction enzyme A